MEFVLLLLILSHPAVNNPLFHPKNVSWGQFATVQIQRLDVGLRLPVTKCPTSILKNINLPGLYCTQDCFAQKKLQQ